MLPVHEDLEVNIMYNDRYRTDLLDWRK